ncbi:MAG: hypothetical protein IH995_09870 [Proteobacteria bacterium]|nr:hypothetical protein [Pseudomonadota bacterium]
MKCRNVFKVGVAYAIVAWVILQFIEVVSNVMNFPDWIAQAVLMLLVAGLPVALLLSWAYEVTPEGVKKTKDVDRSKSIIHGTGQKINKLIAVGFLLALGFIAYDKLIAPDGPTIERAQAGQASIAVLPFADLSPEGDQEYFSDGISEELLNVLAKIPELRVAARTSSFQFKGENQDITNIGQQLNVAYILEGSVRKSGNTVRITAQLIDASNGFHLWSDNYDRSLENIFAVQDEISNAIVGELKTAMGLVVTSEIRTTQATTPEAYDLFLLGVHQMEQRGSAPLAAAAGYFEQALEIDPNYAPAVARLAMTYLLQPGYNFFEFPIGEMRPKAEPLAKLALELDPNLPEAQAAMGFFHVQWGDFEKAEPFYKRALELNPSYTTVRVWFAAMLENLGRFEEGLLMQEQAVRDDPLSSLAVINLINDYHLRGQFEKAAPFLDRLKTLSPQFYHILRAEGLGLQGKYLESFKATIKTLKIDPNTVTAKIYISELLNGRFGLPNEDIRVGLFPIDSLIITGQVGQAEALMERILTFFPSDNIFVMETIGAGYLALGNFNRGREFLELAYSFYLNEEIGIGNMTNSSFRAFLEVKRQIGDEAGLKKLLAIKRLCHVNIL